MAITRIEMNGAQTIDYVWVTTTELTDEDIETIANINYEPKWDSGTIILATFNNTLNGGNIVNTFGKGLVGWSVYRQKADGGYLEYVRTVGAGQSYLVDYNNVFGEEYVYYLFPNTEDTISSPFISNRVKACWTEWALLVCEDGDKENEYKVMETFLFQLNRTVGQMNNNADVQVYKTYTQFPKITKGNSNYLSGQLSSLVGYLNEVEGDLQYYETTEMMDKLQALSTDPRKKFLKDTKGHIWMVELSAPSTFSYEQNMIEQPITGGINWTQIGDTDGISIYNGKMRTKWLLTLTGTPELNVSYVWMNSEYWNDNKIWTAALNDDAEDYYKQLQEDSK